MSDEAFPAFEELRELPHISTPILNVSIDALALLVEFDKDEQKTFEFLGKLKDLFA